MILFLQEMFVQEVVINRNGTLLDDALVYEFRDQLIPSKDFDELMERYNTLVKMLDHWRITKSAQMTLDRLSHGMKVVIDLEPAKRLKSYLGTHFTSTGAEMSFEVGRRGRNNHSVLLTISMVLRFDGVNSRSWTKT